MRLVPHRITESPFAPGGMEMFRKLLRKQSPQVCPSLYQVCYSNSVESLPAFPLKKWDTNVISACTGPNAGITQLDLHAEAIDARELIAGVQKWNAPNDFTHGISVSLYEEDRTQKTSINGAAERKAMRVGEPIADVYGAVVRGNNTILAIADGCSWGKKPRLAARCAVRTALEYLSDNIKTINKKPSSKTVLSLLMAAMDRCHESIIKNKGTLTTLSIAIVCQIEACDTSNWGLFTANLGDSRIFVYCPRYKTFMEASIGSHPSDGLRVVSNSGGALGPAIGTLPDFENLSFSCIPVSSGDIVVLMTDGISDNFQPRVTKSYFLNTEKATDQTSPSTADQPPLCTPHSHQSGDNVVIHSCCQVSSELQSAIRNHHQSLQGHLSAQTVSSYLVNAVAELTEEKRQFLSECIEKGLDFRMEEETDLQFTERKRQKTGKLDHATVLSYKIGQYV